MPSGTLRIGSVACRQRSGSSARPGRCGRDLSALDAVAPRHAVGGPGTSARLGLGQGPTAARSASRVRSERPGQAGRCGGRTRPRGNRGPGPTSGTDPGRVRARGEARSRARSPRWSSWPRRCRRRPAGRALGVSCPPPSAYTTRGRRRSQVLSCARGFAPPRPRSAVDGAYDALGTAISRNPRATAAASESCPQLAVH